MLFFLFGFIAMGLLLKVGYSTVNLIRTYWKSSFKSELKITNDISKGGFLSLLHTVFVYVYMYEPVK